ncbi:hypothetical protein AMEX_G20206 [Astyanax mexicanus]|uniref:CCHC-type domain-containing protein n=1 Tax=Astyanax mexicanus TaxID=7994 RepID=A0A8T2L8U4_ASTMX|nr:hypothetical protein AMEX_G20206 [Astyanax mexicanus]
MEDCERKSLVWTIKKSLLTLTAEELFQLAKEVGPVPGKDSSMLEVVDEEGCFEYIQAYMRSETLLESEDTGMAQLLELNDVINAIIQDRYVQSKPCVKENLDVHHRTSSSQHNVSVLAGQDNVDDNSLISSPILGTQTDTVNDSNSTSVTFQVPPDTTRAKTTSDTDIQKMLSSYAELSQKVLQYMSNPSPPPTCPSPSPSHPASQPYNTPHSVPPEQYLPVTRDKMIPVDLSYLQRLKQKILFASRSTDADVKYNPSTVQDVFLHTVYQGLGQKHDDIRRELKPLLSDSRVTDEGILKHMMKITNDENERQRRLGSVVKPRQVNVNCSQLEGAVGPNTSTKKGNSEKKPNVDMLQQLTEKVEKLMDIVGQLQSPVQAPQPEPSHQYCVSRDPRRGKSYSCARCLESNRTDCTHCFSCGEEGHRAVGCLKKPKRQENWSRSLKRDNQ